MAALILKILGYLILYVYVRQELEQKAAVAEKEAEAAREAARRAEMRRDAAEEQGLCLICWEQPRGVLYLPCNHLVLCAACDQGQAASSCSACSGPIASRHEVHMSQMVADEAVSALGAETGAA